MAKNRWVSIVPAVAVLALTACGDGSTAGPTSGGDRDAATGSGSDPGGEVLVFAAASLTDAFADIEAAFEAANPGFDVQLNLAGSSALREQILEGAPADVFAPASGATMAPVVEAGEAAGEPHPFAINELRIAVPAGNPGGVTSLADLADPDLLVGLCAEGVPCGDLAREALADGGVEASVDTDEPDVRALLAKIGAGELDAGIVYLTDVVAAGDAVEGLPLPPGDATVATYPIVTLAGAPDPDGAAAFVDFVLSDEGRELLAERGFGAP